jgi:hypothetical protein
MLSITIEQQQGHCPTMDQQPTMLSQDDVANYQHTRGHEYSGTFLPSRPQEEYKKSQTWFIKKTKINTEARLSSKPRNSWSRPLIYGKSLF